MISRSGVGFRRRSTTAAETWRLTEWGPRDAGVDVEKFHGIHPWYKYVTEAI